jgi:hypothetical protein
MSIARGKAYSPVDFAFAVLLYSFFKDPTHLNGKLIREMNVIAIYRQMARGARFDKPPNVPETLWQLIERLWHAAPSKRPTFKELVLDFHEHHLYVLPEANLAEVIEYENRILNLKPVRVDDDQSIKDGLRRSRNGSDQQMLTRSLSVQTGTTGYPTTRLKKSMKPLKKNFSWD